MLALSAGTEHLLQWFIITAGVLLIPVVVILIVVLFQTFFLLHAVRDFLRTVSVELLPIVKDLHILVDNIQNVSARTVDSVRDLGDNLNRVKPIVETGLAQIRLRASSLLGGLGRSFKRPF